MSPDRRPSSEGLARLARDLMTPEWPSADLLVRYVDDPDSLSPEERRAFMSALEASPELQAQVQVLQRTSVDDLLARAGADLPRPGRAAPPRRRRWNVLPVLAGATVAALALWSFLPTAMLEPETSTVRSAGPTPPLGEEGVGEVTPAPRRVMEPDARLRYAAPAGATPRPRRESVVTLGDGRELRGVALVPEHVGRTREATPSVFWHTRGIIPDEGEFLLRIARGDATTPLIEMALRERPSPGLQETRFAALGIDLPPAAIYRWSVLYAASAGSAPQPIAEGWIQRYPRETEARDTTPLERAEAAARDGFWYDALSAAHPPGGVLPEARRSLLAGVGLDRILAESESEPE